MPYLKVTDCDVCKCKTRDQSQTSNSLLLFLYLFIVLYFTTELPKPKNQVTKETMNYIKIINIRWKRHDTDVTVSKGSDTVKKTKTVFIFVFIYFMA